MQCFTNEPRYVSELNDRSWSKMTPRFLTERLEAKEIPYRVTMWSNLSLRSLGPNAMKSFLSKLKKEMTLCLQNIKNMLCSNVSYDKHAFSRTLDIKRRLDTGLDIGEIFANASGSSDIFMRNSLITATL